MRGRIGWQQRWHDEPFPPQCVGHPAAFPRMRAPRPDGAACAACRGVGAAHGPFVAFDFAICSLENPLLSALTSAAHLLLTLFSPSASLPRPFGARRFLVERRPLITQAPQMLTPWTAVHCRSFFRGCVRQGRAWRPTHSILRPIIYSFRAPAGAVPQLDILGAGCHWSLLPFLDAFLPSLALTSATLHCQLRIPSNIE